MSRFDETMGGRPVISCEGREVLQRTRVRQVFQRGVGPSAARRVLQSPERFQQPSGEANVSPPRIFSTNPPVIVYV